MYREICNEIDGRIRIHLIQFGTGNIGKRLLEIADNLNKKRRDLQLKYVGLADSSGGIINTEGIEIRGILDAKEGCGISSLNGFEKGLNDFRLIDRAKSQKITECVVVDVTASDSTYTSLLTALEKGYHVVLANKIPLSENYKKFKKLHEQSKKGGGRLLFECTVGAGLPVIYALKSLLVTDDKIIEIKGCFSGTLNYAFTELEKGIQFSDIIKKAKNLGYTEPDPRIDLSGLDVARKALILARLCGYKVELKDVYIESLVPDSLKSCSLDIFIEKLPEYDDKMAYKCRNAAQKGKRLRYIASIEKGSISIVLKEVPVNSPIGSLKGAENICVIKTNRYNSSPLVIQGPGAGIDVTADGVLRNTLECFRLKI